MSRLPSIESAIDPSLVYYTTPENPKSFAKKILYALDDESFDALNVRNFAKDFTWEARARNFVKILK